MPNACPLEGLAVAIDDAVAKGRADKLVAADLQNGTFTINNAGALGSIYTQAIPVPGQAGIVTMESIIKRVVALPDNTIAIRPMMNCTLSFDHRIIDGAEALQFLGAAKNPPRTVHLARSGPADGYADSYPAMASDNSVVKDRALNVASHCGASKLTSRNS